jgi:hypothetical protein
MPQRLPSPAHSGTGCAGGPFNASPSRRLAVVQSAPAAANPSGTTRFDALHLLATGPGYPQPSLHQRAGAP